jgi:excisionase family DNA binding protein
MIKNDRLTFENLPEAVLHLIHEVAEIKHYLLNAATNFTDQPIRELPEKELLSVDDVCQKLGLKKGSVYNLTHRREIPFYKRGQRIYFDKTELNEWVRSDRRKTITELKNDADLSTGKE